MSIEKYLAGRKLYLATMHGKEWAIAPILDKELDVRCVVVKGLDTDVLGTFTGDVLRANSVLSTARAKCDLLKAQLPNVDLVISSEGSFGPHPLSHFVAANEELLLIKDYKYGLEYGAKVTSSNTNYSYAEVTEMHEAILFAKQIGFPQHALVVRDCNTGFDLLHKGIDKECKLTEVVMACIAKYGKARLETDMRAMFNPTRMQVISKAAHQLVKDINRVCLECGVPGMHFKEKVVGLPCSLCGSATESVKSVVYVCQQCKSEWTDNYPNNVQCEDPMYCNYCNP